MKRKISTALLILTCFFALITLSACDAILDLIFGPEDSGEHVHKMEEKTYTGSICTGQNAVTYYQCKECGKYFLDKNGNEELADPATLATGHAYVMAADENDHFNKCKFCNNIDEASREPHSSARYQYDSKEHFKICDVCGAKFAAGEHDNETVGQACSVCNRQGNYREKCNGSYGREQLAVLTHGKNMQALYDEINQVVSSAHDNGNLDAQYGAIDQNKNGYYIPVDASKTPVTYGEACMTMSSFRNDNPLYYWMDNVIGIEMLPSDYVGELKICVAESFVKGADRVARNAEIYAGIDNYISYVGDRSNANAYDVAFALHDKIINDIDYAYVEGSSVPEKSLWAHSIEGVFTKNSAVCEGYAKAFQLLLNVCDVENVYVTGTGNGEGHAWNMVNLNTGDGDKWYLYDLTWDDAPNSLSGIRYNYFCKTEENFGNHVAGPFDAIGSINYLYDLPSVATEPYANKDRLELGRVFVATGASQCNYKLVGYDRAELIKCVKIGEDGVLDIPSSLLVANRLIKITQIGEDAFANYTYKEDGSVDTATSPSIVTIVIPATVEIIYNKSVRDCSTLESVQFNDASNWSRYALNGTSVYENISSADLEHPALALAKLKEIFKQSANEAYAYLWVKSPDTAEEK